MNRRLRAQDVVTEAFVNSVVATITERRGKKFSVELDYDFKGDPLVDVVDVAIYIASKDDSLSIAELEVLREVLVRCGVPPDEVGR